MKRRVLLRDKAACFFVVCSSVWFCKHTRLTNGRRRRKSVLTAYAWTTGMSSFLWLSGESGVFAEEWPHWRGQNRNDVSAEVSGWSEGQWPIEIRWQQKVGAGATSPVIAGGRLYTMGWQNGQDHVVCIHCVDGNLIWQKSYDCPERGRKATGDEGLYSGPSSTPELDPHSGLLFTLSADGDLHCWDTRKDGQPVWGFNLYERYDPPQRPRVNRSGLRDYGYTSSPIVLGDALIVEVGGAEGSLMAFDVSTGERRWRSEATSPAGHNGGPVPMTVDGMSCVALFNHDGLLVVRADSENVGKTIATYPWTTDFANGIATPTVHGDSVLVTSSYNQHKICRFKISLDGALKLWEQSYASKVCSPVVLDGHIYWAWQQVMCLDFATGELKWQGGNCGDPGSCVATADGRLIVLSGQGDLTLVESATRSPNQYLELAKRPRLFGTDAWPHVVLSDGRLYCKDRDGNLQCFELIAAP